jgi:two-component system, LuxR family, response regulator FixJ
VNAPAAAQAPAHRAYVVDDDEGFRRSLVVLLESAGWSVEDFASAHDFAGRSGALEPGILLLDLNLDGTSGLDLLEERQPELERFAVVMVTGAGQIETAVRSIKAGAVDFVEKPFEGDALLERLDAIEKDFAVALHSKSAVWDARRRVAGLSPRERDVLERLLAAMSNKLIARDLDISPRTVEMHRARMVQKLGVATTAEALEIGRLAGLNATSTGVAGL